MVRRTRIALLTLASFVMLSGNAGAYVLCVKKDTKTGGPNAAAPVRAKTSCTSKEVVLDAASLGLQVATTASLGFSKVGTGQMVISNVKINGAVVGPSVPAGSAVGLSFDYFMQDTGCPGCIEQLMIGYQGAANYEACVYSGIPGAGGVNGSANANLTAPSAPGTYFIGFDRSADYSCPAGWWNGSPGADRFIAVLTVR